MGYILEQATKLKDNLINIVAETGGSKIISVESIFDEWIEDKYKIGDVRSYEHQLWRCCQEHDSTINADVIPGYSSAHWVAYHATSAEYAKPFVHPTGAHDIYKAGEYMIYTDNKVYLCKQDTNFSPEEYQQAWKLIEQEV